MSQRRGAAWRRMARRSSWSARPRSARASGRPSPRSPARCWACRPSGSRCQGTDTQFTPYDRSTGASRSTTLAGLAVQRAATAVRADLLEIAATRLAGMLRRPSSSGTGQPGTATKSRTFPQLIAKRFGLSWRPADRGGRRPPRGHRFVRRGTRLLGGLHRCRRGDASTARRAWWRCSRTATIADVGTAINPQLVERQDEGATMQGIGNALFEEMVFGDGAAAQRQSSRVPRPIPGGPARWNRPA